MTFSVCIPNYNYEKYVGEAIRSALAQNVQVEVAVRDNASTDRSVEVIKAIGDPRVRHAVNACNVGYAGNLDPTVRMSSGEIVVVLCSDDYFRPGFLEAVQSVWGAIGGNAIISTANDTVDPEGRVTGRLGPMQNVWTEADRAPELDALAGGPVYRVPAEELLRRCLRTMTNPFNMSTTAYPRLAYDKIGGYGGGRTFNPDKWFHWRLLGAVKEAVFIDAGFGASRWHPNNQTAQQAASGALKYLVDDYVSTFEIDAALLKRLGLTRQDVERTYVEYDIARHGLATLARGSREKARRILLFGASAYPAHVRGNWKLWALAGLLAAGPVGEQLAQLAYRRFGSTESGT